MLGAEVAQGPPQGPIPQLPAPKVGPSSGGLGGHWHRICACCRAQESRDSLAHTRYVLLSFPTSLWTWKGSEPGLWGDALWRSINQDHPAAGPAQLGALEAILEAILDRAELPAGASLLSARCSSPAALPMTLPGTPRPGMARGRSLSPGSISG